MRDEIAMANEAFALSPMSARAAEPNEQDYDAIREAFMETARGRWFLGEYAKRNRNADTSMVLDAVAKIEETLAAQRQPVVEDRLPEALIEIRRAIREAETIGHRRLRSRRDRDEPRRDSARRAHHQGDLLALARDRCRRANLRPH
ncbi:hypothetical protein ABH991_003903 [Bradyrhizobium ottawaense]